MNDDQIYDRLFTAILEQKLRPNKKINEEELGSIFGVSRTIVRQALLRLSLDGAIVLHKNRGAYVAALSPTQVHELYDARRTVERGIVATACQTAEPQDILRLREMIENELESNRNGDRASRIRLSGEFHLEIAKIARNELLHRFLRQLVVQTSIARACYEQRGVSPCSSHDHEGLVEAIAAGDAELAQDLIVRHLRSSEAELEVDEPEEEEDLRSILL